MPADDPSMLVHMHMGCYGLGLSRMIAAIAEVSHDKQGIIWPKSVAPWNCVIIQGKAGGGEHIYDGIASVFGSDEVLFDDRQHVSIGWKCHDAKKIGYPHIVVLGRDWETGVVEVIHRKSGLSEKVETSTLFDAKYWKDLDP